MSIHKSLVSGDRLRRERNVLTRWERIEKLRLEQKWDDERSVYSLPKVKVVRFKKHKKKKEAPTEEGAEGAEGTAEAPAEKTD